MEDQVGDFLKQLAAKLELVLLIWICKWDSDNTTSHWKALNWSCLRGWGGRVTLAFLKVSCIIAIPSFLQSFLDGKLFNFVLRGAIAYRYCIIQSHNGKS